MRKILLEEYLANPCATCATAFWKNEECDIPQGITVVHENNYINNSELKPTKYFRLLHNLEKIGVCEKAGFYFQKVDLNQGLTIIKNILDECYETDYSLDEIVKWSKFRVFDNNLWLLIYDGCLNKPVALGIADFDANVKEGSLEWIQVLPKYRGLSIGQILVNQLLMRLKSKADFVTVSGQCDNESIPERLYRKCGFFGNDIWYVTVKTNKI